MSGRKAKLQVGLRFRSLVMRLHPQLESHHRTCTDMPFQQRLAAGTAAAAVPDRRNARHFVDVSHAKVPPPGSLVISGAGSLESQSELSRG